MTDRHVKTAGQDGRSPGCAEPTATVNLWKGHCGVPAENFLGTLRANVDNRALDDRAFREFVRNSLPIVLYPRPGRRAGCA